MSTTDDARPDAPSVEQMAEDLSLSNLEGTSWFNYAWDPKDPEVIMLSLYNEVGEIVKTFKAWVEFEDVETSDV